MRVAGTALKSNLTTLGPRVLPWAEQLKFAANTAGRWLIRRNVSTAVPFLPDCECHCCDCVARARCR